MVDRPQPRLRSWRGPHVQWMPIPFLSPLRPFPVSRYCCTPVSPTPFPTLLSFSVKFSKEVRGSTVRFPQPS